MKAREAFQIQGVGREFEKMWIEIEHTGASDVLVPIQISELPRTRAMTRDAMVPAVLT